MVRIKTRWLLVRIDFKCDNLDSDDDKVISKNENVETITSITNKELARVIRDNLIQCSGVALSGAAQDTQVRFYDNIVQLALIRVPREYCHVVRASITLLTELRNHPVVLSTLSVKGSARTAKLDAIQKLRHGYRERLNHLIRVGKKKSNTSQLTNKTRQEIDRMCRSMEESIDTLTNIDY